MKQDNDWEKTLKEWWYSDERTYEQAVYFIKQVIAEQRSKAVDEFIEKAEDMVHEIKSTKNHTNMKRILYVRSKENIELSYPDWCEPLIKLIWRELKPRTVDTTRGSQYKFMWIDEMVKKEDIKQPQKGRNMTLIARIIRKYKRWRKHKYYSFITDGNLSEDDISK